MWKGWRGRQSTLEAASLCSFSSLRELTWMRPETIEEQQILSQLSDKNDIDKRDQVSDRFENYLVPNSGQRDCGWVEVYFSLLSKSLSLAPSLFLTLWLTLNLYAPETSRFVNEKSTTINIINFEIEQLVLRETRICRCLAGKGRRRGTIPEGNKGEGVERDRERHRESLIEKERKRISDREIEFKLESWCEREKERL